MPWPPCCHLEHCWGNLWSACLEFEQTGATTSRQQPLRWSQLWRGHSCSYGLDCNSRRNSWTGLFQCLQPEQPAVFREWRWWAKLIQPPSQEGSHRSGLGCTWWSTTLAKQNRVRRVLLRLLHIIHINMYRKVQAWFHRSRHARCQQVLPGHLFWLTWRKEASTNNTRHCPDLAPTFPPLAGLASEDKVFSVISMVHHLGKLPSTADASSHRVLYGWSAKSQTF